MPHRLSVTHEMLNYHRFEVAWVLLHQEKAVQVFRKRENGWAPWGKAEVWLWEFQLRHCTAETAEQFIANLTGALRLGAEIARAWDAGEPLPEEVQ